LSSSFSCSLLPVRVFHGRNNMMAFPWSFFFFLRALLECLFLPLHTWRNSRYEFEEFELILVFFLLLSPSLTIGAVPPPCLLPFFFFRWFHQGGWQGSQIGRGAFSVPSSCPLLFLCSMFLRSTNLSKFFLPSLFPFWHE